MAKFRKIPQKTTFTRREQYENALTFDRAKNRAKQLSYAEVDIGDGEIANVYFTSMPASLLRLKEKGLDPMVAIEIIFETLADCVVDPGTGKPIMSIDDWRKEDSDFINRITSAVMGIQLVTEDEAADLPEGEVIETEDEDASDPNPLDATVGLGSPTTSTENSNPDKEMSSGG